MGDLFHQIGHQLSVLGPRIIWAVILFILFYFASWILAATIRTVGRRVDVHQVVTDLLAQIVGTTILIVGIVCVLGTLGVDTTALVASLGLAGFAVGFALKDVLSNVLSGILLLYYRPFWITDRLKVSGHEGEVIDIDLRYTSLKSDNSVILLPNSSLFTNSVEIVDKKATNEANKTVSAVQAEQHSEKQQ